MNRHPSIIECLEQRIAPSGLTFTDVDGDKLLLTVTGGTAAVSTTAQGVTGGVQINNITIGSGSHVKLSLTVTARGAHGDGLANVGMVTANAGVTFDSISIPGDLGELTVPGTGSATDVVVKSLSVHSVGQFGNATGATLNGSNTAESDIGGSIGSIKVGADFTGDFLNVTGSIGSLGIRGSLIGGSTQSSGEILSSLAMGPVDIGRDVIGGSGTLSGAIVGENAVKSVTIGGSVLGADGPESAYILKNTSTGDMGPVKIGGELAGGIGAFSGTVNSFGNLKSVTIGGSMSGIGQRSGAVFMQLGTGTLGPVKIGRNVTGTAADYAATVFSSGNITSVSIGGSLQGGGGGGADNSGSIEATKDLGTVSIGGDLQFGNSAHSGIISAGGTLATVSVRGWSTGSVISTGNIGSLKFGSYFAGDFEVSGGGIHSISIAGDVTGQNDSKSSQDIGSIFIGGSITDVTAIESENGKIGSIVVNGSIETDSDISAHLDMPSAIIKHDLDGGLASVMGNIGTVKVGGNMIAGDITAINGDIGAISVAGSVGNALIISDIASSSVDAKIGSIKVGGDWVASSVTAGFKDTGNNGFGNGDDTLFAKSGTIGSISIGGEVIGTATPTTDHFGFDAQSIASFKMGSDTFKPGATPADITLSYDTAGDVGIHIAQS